MADVWASPWHVIPEPPAILQGAATPRIQCRDPRATCHIAGCCHLANSTAFHPRATYHTAGCCHLVNSLSWFQSHMHGAITCQNHDRATLHGVIIPSAILKIVFAIFTFLFFNAVWALTSGGVCVVSNTLVSRGVFAFCYQIWYTIIIIIIITDLYSVFRSEDTEALSDRRTKWVWTDGFSSGVWK